jgi:alkylation response protein AidB-like acyl-CoA dehydrogenase
MDFAISDRVQPLVEEVRAFMREEVFGLEHLFLSGDNTDYEPLLEEVRRKVKDQGWWAPHMEKSLGGMGLSLVEFAVVSEELGRSPLGHFVFNAQAPDVGNMELLHAHGSDGQKKEFLEPLVAGEIRSCFGMTEPEFAGSNPTRLATTAVRDGDDYLLDGHKWFTSSADGANFCVVMAVTDPTHENKYARASMFLVPLKTPGFELVQNLSIMGHRGGGYFSHGEVRLTGVRVPEGYRLGPEGAGFLLAQERLGPGRIHHCMRWIGVCERAFDLMCERAAERDLTDSLKVADMQLVQGFIAESRAEIDAARLLVLRTAWAMAQNGNRAAREEISLIKFHVAGILQRVLDRAIQVQGGRGLTDQTPLAFWYAHERGARIYDGPDEVHKMVVAKAALRRFGHEGRR